MELVDLWQITRVLNGKNFGGDMRKMMRKGDVHNLKTAIGALVCVP